jgi:hypothetical protein
MTAENVTRISEIHFHLLAAPSRPSCPSSSTLCNNERAQGRPGAGWHPWPPVRQVALRMHRRKTTGEAGCNPAFPAQWFDDLCRALPGDEFVLPPSLRELTARVALASAKLSTSNGCQDHTVLPYATSPLVRRGKRSLTAKAALRFLSRATLSVSTAARTPRIETTRTPLLDEAGYARQSS